LGFRVYELYVRIQDSGFRQSYCVDRLEKEGGGGWGEENGPLTTLSLDAHTHVHISSRTHDLAADTNNRLTAHTAHIAHAHSTRGPTLLSYASSKP
jgi:hypothetical protein